MSKNLNISYFCFFDALGTQNLPIISVKLIALMR